MCRRLEIGSTSDQEAMAVDERPAVCTAAPNEVEVVLDIRLLWPAWPKTETRPKLFAEATCGVRFIESPFCLDVSSNCFCRRSRRQLAHGKEYTHPQILSSPAGDSKEWLKIRFFLDKKDPHSRSCGG